MIEPAHFSAHSWASLITSSKYLVLRLFHCNKTLRKCFSVFCCFYLTVLLEIPWDQQMCQHYSHFRSSISHSPVAGFKHKCEWDYFSNLIILLKCFTISIPSSLFLLCFQLCAASAALHPLHYNFYPICTLFLTPSLPPWLLTAVVEGRDYLKELLLMLEKGGQKNSVSFSDNRKLDVGCYLQHRDTCQERTIV